MSKYERKSFFKEKNTHEFLSSFISLCVCVCVVLVSFNLLDVIVLRLYERILNVCLFFSNFLNLEDM